MNSGIDNFNKLLYNHIAGIYRDVSYLPDEFFDLLLEYKNDKKYLGFDEDTIKTTIEELYIDFVKYLIDENKEKLNEYFNGIYKFINDFPEDLSGFHSLAILIMLFDKKDIDAINSITDFIQDIIRNNQTLIIDYLKNNIDKYKWLKIMELIIKILINVND